MTEYAHNHPPRCCCHSWPIAEQADRYTPCPLCPEHGELAQLGGGNTRAIGEYVLQGGTTTEYPCCHQLAGRPHTDYCPRMAVPSQPDDDTPVLGDTTIADVRRTANPFGIPTAVDPNVTGIVINQLHIAAPDVINQGAIIPTHDRHQCHPDRCGMWATQTTQPASQTSTPNTEVRDPRCTCQFLNAYRTHYAPSFHREGCPIRDTPLAEDTPGCTCDPGPLGQHQPYCGDYLT